MALEFVGAVGATIVGGFASLTLAPIGRHLGFVFHYRSKQDSLRTRVRELDNALINLRRRVETAQRNGEVAEAGLAEWLEEAERRSGCAKQLLSGERAGCDSVSLRYRIGKEASEMAQSIGADVQKADKFGFFFYRPILRSSFQNRGFVAFASTIQTQGEIIKALRDPDLGVIGVYGAGGIGKSSIVLEVAREVQGAPFVKVVIVTVSQTYSIENIQQQIAEDLGLILERESVGEKAKRLKNHFRGASGNVLIILDDVWEEIEFEAIGICLDGACKILLVSRDRNVLCTHRDLKMDIQVEYLSRKDAMLLFSKFVVEPDRGTLENSRFDCLASQIVAECGGLPIAIVTIASLLRNKSVVVWEDALNRLREEGDFGDKVRSTVKTSYDYLVQEEKLVKPLLLLCSLHGEDADINVEELITYVIGLDMFGFVRTLEIARKRVNALINRLKAHSLLGDGVNDGYVKMHDVIRDVVLSIAVEEEHMYCFTNSEKLEYSLEKGHLDNSTAIVWHMQSLGRLPERLPCPRLDLLLMFNHGLCLNRSMLIPDQYFEETKALKVLSFCGIDLLPSNFSSLQNLQTLCLRMSGIRNVALIGELKSLIILDISSLDLEELPETIGQLTRLRQLNLNNCPLLVRIQPNVISKLVNLEELYIRNHLSDKYYATLFVELQNLSRLRVLELSLPYTSVIPYNISERLEWYIIEIGCRYVHLSGKRSRVLRIVLDRICLGDQPGLHMLMKKSHVLFLDGTLERVINFFPQIDLGGFQGLKNLHVKSNNQIRHIVGTAHQRGKTTVFPSLETLTLRELKNLEELQCHDETMESESFGQLKNIHLEKCFLLKRIFPLDILRKLEAITVSNCSIVEEICSSSETHYNGADGQIEFPCLKRLELCFLPRLIHFFASKFDAACLSSLPNAPTPPFFNRQVSFPSLTDLKLVGIIMSSHFWGNQSRATSFMQNLTNLTVEQCNSLCYIFPSEVAGALLQIKCIKVGDCSNVEEVVRATNQSPTTFVWPKLESIELIKLPSLKKFYASYTDSTPDPYDIVQEHSLFDEKLLLPCLTYLEVESCASVKCLFSYTISTSLSRLGSLDIGSCDAMEAIVNFEVPMPFERSDNSLFSALMDLHLSYLPSLEVFCSESCCDYLSLRNLTIKSCPKLCERGKHEKNVESKNLCVVSLPKLLGSCGSDWKNLDYLVISDCDDLDCLFTSDEAKCLEKLKTLIVSRCKNMEEVVATEGSLLNNFSFSNLDTIDLFSLARMTRFCVADCIQCPLLRQLMITDCPEFGSFIVNNFTFRDGDIGWQEPVARETLVCFPELKYLKVINWNGSELWPRQCSTVLFPKLGFLQVACTRRVAIINLPNCPMIENIFLSGSFMKIAWPQLETEHVRDGELPSLLHLLEHPEISETVLPTETVAYLEVDTPSGLKTLTLSSFASFLNLKELRVTECHRIKYLFTSSTAKSLVNLTELEIVECKQITEVIAIQSSEPRGTELIVFRKLQVLWLIDLPSLRAFHDGLSEMEFPEMRELVVEDCTEMKRFSQVVSATNLHNILSGCKLSSYKRNWEGDINATIRKNWAEDSGSALRQLFSATGFDILG